MCDVTHPLRIFRFSLGRFHQNWLSLLIFHQSIDFWISYGLRTHGQSTWVLLCTKKKWGLEVLHFKAPLWQLLLLSAIQIKCISFLNTKRQDFHSLYRLSTQVKAHWTWWLLRLRLFWRKPSQCLGHGWTFHLQSVHPKKRRETMIVIVVMIEYTVL